MKTKVLGVLPKYPTSFLGQEFSLYENELRSPPSPERRLKPFRQTFGLPPFLSGTAFDFGRLPCKGSCHTVTEGL